MRPVETAMRTFISFLFVAACAAGCASPQPLGDTPEVRMFPDDPANPKVVRFEAPSALVIGLPGDRVPATLEARIGSRDIAARMLAAHGYCPNGFTGPEGIHFPDRDRARAVFEVRCKDG
jgi:hypothetical protein